MALLPSITLIAGGSLLAVLGGRRARIVHVASAGLTLVIVVLLYVQLPESLELAIWRPIELFGPGFEFEINAASWPFLLLCSVVILADAVRGPIGPASLFYAATALAATVTDNLLSAVLLWSLMALFEAAKRLRGGGGGEIALRKLPAQAVAVVLLMAAAYGGEFKSLLLTGAVLMRAGGVLNFGRPLSLATFPAIASFSFASQANIDMANPAWLWFVIAVAVLVQSLAFGTSISGLAIGLAAASLASAQDVIWVAAAGVLVFCLGVLRTAGSRFAWIPVGLFPLAFIPSRTATPTLWVVGLALTVVLTALVRLLGDGEDIKMPGRSQFVALSALLAATVFALMTSNLNPGVFSLLVAGIGLGTGYAVALLHPRLAGYRQPIEDWATYSQELIGNLFRVFGTAIRTAVNVLEGESAVLWILLVLLIAVIGLQVIAA